MLSVVAASLKEQGTLQIQRDHEDHWYAGLVSMGRMSDKIEVLRPAQRAGAGMPCDRYDQPQLLSEGRKHMKNAMQIIMSARLLSL